MTEVSLTDRKALDKMTGDILAKATVNAGGGRSAVVHRDRLDVGAVVMDLQTKAAADPQVAKVLRHELERRMSPQDAAQMNRMLAGETWLSERVSAAVKNPAEAIVGAEKKFANGLGDLVSQAGRHLAAISLSNNAVSRSVISEGEIIPNRPVEEEVKNIIKDVYCSLPPIKGQFGFDGYAILGAVDKLIGPEADSGDVYEAEITC